MENKDVKGQSYQIEETGRVRTEDADKIVLKEGMDYVIVNGKKIPRHLLGQKSNGEPAVVLDDNKNFDEVDNTETREQDNEIDR